MNLVASVMILFSVLVPSKIWYGSGHAIEVKIDAKEAVHLVAVDFAGKALDAESSAEVAPGATADLKTIFPKLTAQTGAYVVFAVPQGRKLPEFVGTPLVVQSRGVPRFGGPVGVSAVKVSPLLYGVMETSEGPMKMLFWYDVAPNTVASFTDLSAGGFFDGLTFHRIVPGFVVQGGDPTGTGFGGPGYQLGAEFSDRAHEEGVLSMARTGDPLESKGIAPRPEFANSAGSQFFICLSREKCAPLNGKYTAFGRVFAGLDTLKKLAATPLANENEGKPVKAPVIQSVKLVPVTSGDNPYAEMLRLDPSHSALGDIVPDAAPTAPVTAEPAK